MNIPHKLSQVDLFCKIQRLLSTSVGPKFNEICLERGEGSLHYVCPFRFAD